jgi:hypothetical protein
MKMLFKYSLGVVFAVVLGLAPAGLYAQGGAPRTPSTAKASAPIDLTGYWVSLVTEDWRFRMVTPPKGDYESLPLNPEGRKVADVWDPAKDEASGNQCKAYGAPAIMRVPGRVHITWQDDSTLKVEMDNGMQTRLFHFGPAPNNPGTDWQGGSTASWDISAGARSVLPGAGMKVVTTGMKAGYLRKNGVPYSANAVVTEYFDRVDEANGDSYLIVKTMVQDPAYLNQPFVTSSHFKKQADASGWDPTPCAAR